MKLRMKLASGLALLALGLVPAMGIAEVDYTPAPPKAPKGKAPGYYCKGESKKHVKGEKGTAFSRCVRAMEQAAKNKKMAPGQACKGVSKEQVKGEKGTAFSRCVKSVNKMRQQEKAASSSAGAVA